MNKLFPTVSLLIICITHASLSAFNVSLKPEIVVEFNKNKATSFIANSWKKLKAAYHNATTTPTNPSQEAPAPSAPEDKIALFIKNHPKVIYFILGAFVGAYAYKIGHVWGTTSA